MKPFGKAKRMLYICSQELGETLHVPQDKEVSTHIHPGMRPWNVLRTNEVSSSTMTY